MVGISYASLETREELTRPPKQVQSLASSFDPVIIRAHILRITVNMARKLATVPIEIAVMPIWLREAMSAIVFAATKTGIRLCCEANAIRGYQKMGKMSSTHGATIMYEETHKMLQPSRECEKAERSSLTVHRVSTVGLQGCLERTTHHT
jgi:hypothetical protein